jgi:hypothetical protein
MRGGGWCFCWGGGGERDGGRALARRVSFPRHFATPLSTSAVVWRALRWPVGRRNGARGAYRPVDNHHNASTQ